MSATQVALNDPDKTPVSEMFCTEWEIGVTKNKTFVIVLPPYIRFLLSNQSVFCRVFVGGGGLGSPAALSSWPTTHLLMICCSYMLFMICFTATFGRLSCWNHFLTAIMISFKLNYTQSQCLLASTIRIEYFYMLYLLSVSWVEMSVRFDLRKANYIFEIFITEIC